MAWYTPTIGAFADLKSLLIRFGRTPKCPGCADGPATVGIPIATLPLPPGCATAAISGTHLVATLVDAQGATTSRQVHDATASNQQLDTLRKRVSRAKFRPADGPMESTAGVCLDSLLTKNTNSAN